MSWNKNFSLLGNCPEMSAKSTKHFNKTNKYTTITAIDTKDSSTRIKFYRENRVDINLIDARKSIRTITFISPSHFVKITRIIFFRIDFMTFTLTTTLFKIPAVITNVLKKIVRYTLSYCTRKVFCW